MLSANKNNSHKNIFTMSMLLASLIVARLSCIALSNIPLFGIGFVFLYAIGFILLFVISSVRMNNLEMYALIALFVYLFEVVLSVLIVGKGLFETQAFNAYILTILFFLYMYVKRLPVQKQRFFVFLALLGYIFTFMYSILKLAQDPMLSRVAATGRFEEDSADTIGAIGGFDTVYGGLLVFVVLAYLWAIVDNKRIKLFFIIGCISCVIFIIMATYATAIVLLVVIIALMIYKKNMISACILVLAVTLCFLFHSELGGVIMSWSKTVNYSNTFQEKMFQIGYMIKYGESVGTLAGTEGRWARIGWSLETFWNNPFFGGFTTKGAKIGSHSEFADLLGRFGLIGFISMSVFFVCLYKDIARNIFTITGKKILSISIIIYLAIWVLDPALYTQQVLPIFLLIPFAEKWARQEV